MSTFLRKAVRDLQRERARSVSIVAALALGIAGFLAVLSAYAILTRSLNDGYLATNPAAATLKVERLEDAGVRAASGTPGVGDVEGRRSVHGRAKSGPAEWRNLILFARSDLRRSRINRIALESGVWPSGPDEISLERDALGVARARVGETLIVRTSAGKERALRVVGSTHDVGKAQARMEDIVYGYVAFDALTALGEEPYFDELAITVAQGSGDVARTREVAQAVAVRIAPEARVLRIDVPESGEHPHAKIMGLLLLSIAAFGIFVLALSGAIVFNVLTALLAGQTRQIGVMKALGGSRRQIASIFLLEAWLLGVAAIVLALPLGILGGRALSRMMSGFLNFDIATYALPAWVFVAVFVVGMGVPVGAALLPVWLGTRTSVRDALAPGGKVGRSYGTSIIDRALGEVGGTSWVLLALRNAERSRLRVALTAGTLILAGIFSMSALNLRQTMIKTIDRLLDGQRPDLSVTLTGDGPVEALERAARSTPGVVTGEAWITLEGEYARVSAGHGGAGALPPSKVSLVGVPAQSRFIRFDLAGGRGLDEAGPGAVVNDALYELAGRPAFGAEVMLRVGAEEVPLAVVGVTREPFALPTAYVTREWFGGQRTPGTANVVQIALAGAEPAAVEAAKTGVEAGLEREGLHVQQSNTRAERRYVLNEHMVMIYVFLVVVACILGAVGVLGLFTTISLNVSERRREVGVMRAIGATPAQVIRIVVTEGVVVGAVAWLIAVVTAGPIGGAIGNGLLSVMFRTRSDLAIAVEPKGIWVWLAVSLAGSAIASLRPAWQASRMSIREALTYE